MERIITAPQVADLLQVHVRTVYRLAVRGLIPGRKIGRSWRFIEKDILSLLSATGPDASVPIGNGLRNS